MTTIVIGRKELFSFAERHSSRHLSDYSSLADGEVLCCLFNLVFPDLRIRPAAAQTHSCTQRAHINWEQLFRRFGGLHIPLPFLNPTALREGSAECGFSTLVLFYFFHHLSKRADFSAEFALDVSEDVTAYLQSTDCIATLLLGNALQWAAVPDSLAQTLRVHPVFHVTEEARAAQEEEAARIYRSAFVRRRTGTANSIHNLPTTRRALPRTAVRESGMRVPSSMKAVSSSSFPAASSSTLSAKEAAASRILGSLPNHGLTQSFRSSTARRLSSDDEDSSLGLSGLQHRCNSEAHTQNAKACGSSRREAPQQRSSSLPSVVSVHSSVDSHCSTAAPLSIQAPDTAAAAVVQPPHVWNRSVSSLSSPTASQASAVSSSRARDAALEVALQSKEAECESLQMQVAQLLTLLASTRAAVTASPATNGESHVLSPSQPTAAAAPVSKQGGYTLGGGSTEGQQQHWSDRIEGLGTQLRVDREARVEGRAPSAPSPPAAAAAAAPAPSPPSGVVVDRSALEAEIEALTSDIVDEETGTSVVDVHQKANLLHCLLLEHLQESPRNRKQMQQWLWSIVAAHHTMEGRLMAAVDLLRLWSSTLPLAGSCHVGDTSNLPVANKEAPAVTRRRLSTAAALSPAASPVSVSDTTDPQLIDHTRMRALRSAHYTELESLHAREHQLAAALQAMKARNVLIVQRAVRRERLWKSLCASVYGAEQASYAITECRTAEEVEERLRLREEHYGVVEALTQQLVEEGLHEETTYPKGCEREGASEPSSACTSLQTLVAQLQEERSSLLGDVARLHDVLAALQAQKGSTASGDLVGAPKETPGLAMHPSATAAPLFDGLHRKSATVADGNAGGTSTICDEMNLWKTC
ncbi:hypothetical protein JKF63_07701 [Porcisia hertigi]|uniref:Uncharacterized protein n=1 Tax=Porcisia hertigi TaxID=2761500 RepID=A0A836YI67_9TRYP|nr:hypothetical protein JKF63_07701 [Porcisia hertigi]